MGLISISVLVASVVYVFVRPPTWMPLWFTRWRQGHVPSLSSSEGASSSGLSEASRSALGSRTDGTGSGGSVPTASASQVGTATSASGSKDNDSSLMPPPPIPKITNTSARVEPAEETTPKAKPSKPLGNIPVFSIDTDSSATPSSISMPPAPSLSMPPPPRPSSNKPTASPNTQNTGRIPTLGQFPAANSIQRARGPAPSRAPPTASSSLTPPPTITSKPQKPSRKVLLEPGHSPLDWASISGLNADLRGVPPETPYLKVTPSMLKEKTGRKGKDAWMAINGKVYNVTPYAKFHPGGVQELMRGAGRDGTKLFWEIHPWVNYDTMLAACLVGLMVEEPEGSGSSKMDEMD